jgi:hypothetical protein
MDAASHEIQPTVKQMGTWHKDHIGADRREPKRRADLVTDRQRADATRKDGRAEWLQEKVLADVGQAAAQAPMPALPAITAAAAK